MGERNYLLYLYVNHCFEVCPHIIIPALAGRKNLHKRGGDMYVHDPMNMALSHNLLNVSTQSSKHCLFINIIRRLKGSNPQCPASFSCTHIHAFSHHPQPLCSSKFIFDLRLSWHEFKGHTSTSLAGEILGTRLHMTFESPLPASPSRKPSTHL